MIPTEIRVYPLSKIKEKEVFATIEMVQDYFCRDLPSRNPPGRFNIPSNNIVFKKGALVLFQYTEIKGEEQIVAHAKLISDGYVHDKFDSYYIGYYLFDTARINFYNTPVSKKEIYNIWN